MKTNKTAPTQLTDAEVWLRVATAVLPSVGCSKLDYADLPIDFDVIDCAVQVADDLLVQYKRRFASQPKQVRQLRVGDAVRILSDAEAFGYGCSIVEAYNGEIISAVGLIGVITQMHPDTTAARVGNLPEECGRIAWYRLEQIELVSDADEPA